MTAEKPLNVLFLCTGNSARSILAEAILNKIGTGRFSAYSAGSHPKDQVNPFSIRLLKSLGFNTSTFRSKSWDEFAQPGAPPIDIIITVCDDAAGESCPVWPGKPVAAHWGIRDPAAVQGTDEVIADAFREAYRLLEQRISQFVALPVSTLDKATLQQKLRDIGRAEGATAMAEAQ